MYYELKYRPLDGGSTRSILVECETYTEAESHCPPFGEVVAIAKRGKIKEVEGPLALLDGNCFYIVSVLAETINDQGKPKKIRYQVVTQAPAVEPSKAAKQVEDLMKQGYDMIAEAVSPAKFDEII